MTNPRGVLCNKLQSDLYIPFGHDNDRALNPKCTETEQAQPITVVEWHRGQCNWDAGHWGQGGLETNENILSTLQALVEGTRHLPADNRLGTF